jgi:hypothetical protein
MPVDASGRMRVAISYAVWTIICASAAGLVTALIHTWWFSYIPNRSGLIATLLGDVATALGIAAGQGAVALATASILAQLGRDLKSPGVLGLLLGGFDFVMYFLQMAVPRSELGWIPDVVILVAVTVGITLYGSVRRGVAF